MEKPGAAAEDLKIKVMAYAGYKANERPLYFLLDHNRIDVKEILGQWTEPENDYFKVLGDDGREYLLRWNRLTDQWFLVKSAKES